MLILYSYEVICQGLNQGHFLPRAAIPWSATVEGDTRQWLDPGRMRCNMRYGYAITAERRQAFWLDDCRACSHPERIPVGGDGAVENDQRRRPSAIPQDDWMEAG
jgi:hypothetical protein